MRAAFAAAATLIALRALAQAPPSLGDAASFAVLGGSGVTSSGESVVTGNVGVSPGETIAGFPPGRVELGAIFRRDATARAAQRDSAAAFDDLAARACRFPLTALEGTLPPGVYCLPSASLAGTLILDADDDPDAVWIFQIAGALTTADDSRVVVTGGGSGGRVFWHAGGSVTLGARSAFIGTILARTNITLGRQARLSGRALARTGAVTLDANAVSMCCPAIVLSPSILPPPVAGLPYAQAITATGGAAPYTFTVTSGALPAGLALDATTGVLSGIATAAGRFDFVITATDANGCSGSELYALPTTASVPALSGWALVMMAALLGGIGLVMVRRALTVTFVAVLLFGTAAAAQQRPIFDVDDFVDPREHDGVLFVSRLVAGGAWNAIDDYRPLHQDTAFVQVANSLYVSRFQFDYKRSEVRDQRELTWRSPETAVTLCGCDPPILFPTAPPSGATPAPPLPGSKDTLQLAWYDEASAGFGPRPMMLRYRLTWSRQPIDTVVTSAVTGLRVARLSGNEQSLGLDADTYFRLRGREIFGSLQYAYTKRSGTTDDRTQRELVYTSRFPAVAAGPVILRATLTVGGVSERGGTAVNVVHPAFEGFWRPAGSEVAFHLVWTPQSTRSGAEGWRTTHQIALFADRSLFVKRFRQ